MHICVSVFVKYKFTRVREFIGEQMRGLNRQDILLVGRQLLM